MNELPARKPNRLEDYDYSQNGAYFVTVCVKDRAELLCDIVFDTAVGGDAHIAPRVKLTQYAETVNETRIVSETVISVGGGVPDAPPSIPATPRVELTQYGDVVAKNIAEICRHYDNIDVPHYVIMPNHIHLIVCVSNSGTSRTPSPTNAVIPAFISTLKRFTNKQIGFSIWQRSFHDRVIRGEDEYRIIAEYIDTNPAKWREDCFYNH